MCITERPKALTKSEVHALSWIIGLHSLYKTIKQPSNQVNRLGRWVRQVGIVAETGWTADMPINNLFGDTTGDVPSDILS